GLAGKEMDRSKNKIEPIPIGLDPSQPRGGTCRIIVQFDSSKDFNVREFPAKRIKHIKINTRQISVVVCECNALDSLCTASFDPRLKQLDSIGADIVTLRVCVI